MVSLPLSPHSEVPHHERLEPRDLVVVARRVQVAVDGVRRGDAGMPHQAADLVRREARREHQRGVRLAKVVEAQGLHDARLAGQLARGSRCTFPALEVARPVWPREHGRRSGMGLAGECRA